MISIIIPTLNEEKVIESTVTRLKKALTLEHEIIISDSHSDDNTIEIARKVADKVVVFSGDKKKRTISMIRNNGARIASGEFFVFLDSDCVIKDADNILRSSIDKFNKYKKGKDNAHSNQHLMLTLPRQILIEPFLEIKGISCIRFYTLRQRRLRNFINQILGINIQIFRVHL